MSPRTSTRKHRIVRLSALPPRRDEAELLDRLDNAPADLAANLRDLRFINRWFGGVAIVARYVRRALVGRERASLLDVATGSADVPVAIWREMRARGIRLQVTAVDVNPAVLAITRDLVDEADIALREADARHLDFPAESFDVVTCSLALHHLSPRDAETALRELWRIARQVVVVVDLRRSRAAYVATWLITHTLVRGHLTRHDGPLSVLRAYTPEEARTLAGRAGMGNVAVHRHFPFRYALVAHKVRGS